MAGGSGGQRVSSCRERAGSSSRVAAMLLLLCVDVARAVVAVVVFCLGFVWGSWVYGGL